MPPMRIVPTQFVRHSGVSTARCTGYQPSMKADEPKLMSRYTFGLGALIFGGRTGKPIKPSGLNLRFRLRLPVTVGSAH